MSCTVQLHLVPLRQERLVVAALRRIEIEMQIAVAQMAEADRPRARDISPAPPRSPPAMKSGIDATGTEISCLIEAPSRFCASEMAFAQVPQSCAPGFRSAPTTASVTRPRAIASRQRRPRSASFSDGRRAAGTSISTYQGEGAGKRIAGVAEYASAPVPARCAGSVRRRKQARRLRACICAQQRQRRGRRGQGGEGGDASAAGLGNSFSAAAVTMPSVPSAPMKICLRS